MCNHYNDNNLTKRTDVAYDHQISVIENDPDFSSVYGIKSRSPLNQLRYFHVAGHQPFDIFHDIYEGLAIDVISNVTRYFIQNGYISISQFNNKLLTFSYTECDKADKPQLIKKSGSWSSFKVKQHAVEMSNLIRLYPLLFGDFVDVGNDYWELLVSFVELVQLLAAPSFSPGETDHIRDIIECFLENYFLLFPDEHLKPKGHFITHYPRQILELGAPIDHDLVRFEGKHNYFKEVYHRSKNKNNIIKTLALRHQFFMYLTYKQENVLAFDAPTTVCGLEVPVTLLDTNIQTVINEICGEEKDVIFQAKGVTFEGHRYSQNTAVVLDFTDDNFQFGKVESVLFLINVPYILYRRLYTGF